MERTEADDAQGGEAVASAAALAPPALVTALAALWGALLLVVFVRANPELASMPRLVAAALSFSADHGANVGPALGRDAAAVALAFGIALACYGFGRIAGRVLPAPSIEGVAVEAAYFALGAGFAALLVFASVHLHLLTTATGVGLLAAGWACLGVSVWGSRPIATMRAARRAAAAVLADRWMWPSLAAVAVTVPWVLATALAPPTARDALTYHLALPKQYIAANAIVETPFNVHAYLPFSTEMLYTWVLLVGPDLAAQVLHAVFCAVVAAVVYAYGTRLGGAPRWGALAAALFVSVPSIAWNAGIAHNEMPMALAVTIAFLALGAWYETRRTADLAWFALAYGLSLSAKHTTLILAPAFGLVVLWRLRSDPPQAQVRNAVVAAAVCGLALVFPVAWYAQNFVRTGNPVFPYFWGAFPSHSPVWDADRVALLEGYLRTTYGNATLAGLLALPWDVSLLAREDVPRRFDGVIGPAFLLLAPFVAWLVVRHPADVAARWRVAALLLALAFVTWASQSQQIRFLIPFLPMAIALGVAALTSRRLAVGVRRALVACLAATIALDAGVLAASVADANPVRVAVGLEPREVYLARRLGYIGYYRLLEREMGPGDRVLLVDMRNDTYDLDRPALSDSVLEDYSVGKIANGARGPDDVYAALRALGITHVLSRDEILLDPRFTPFDDDAARERWLACLARHATRRAGDGRYVLYALDTSAQQNPTESPR